MEIRAGSKHCAENHWICSSPNAGPKGTQICHIKTSHGLRSLMANCLKRSTESISRSVERLVFTLGKLSTPGPAGNRWQHTFCGHVRAARVHIFRAAVCAWRSVRYLPQVWCFRYRYRSQAAQARRDRVRDKLRHHRLHRAPSLPGVGQNPPAAGLHHQAAFFTCLVCAPNAEH